MLLPTAPHGSSERPLFCPGIRSDIWSHRVSNLQNDQLMSTLVGFRGHLWTPFGRFCPCREGEGCLPPGEVTPTFPPELVEGASKDGGCVCVPGTQGVFLGF